MSDQPRDDDFGGLGSRFLEEALNVNDDTFRDEPPRREPEPEPLRTEPRPPQGGVRPALERKRREIIDLEKKIEGHRQTKVYEAKDANGGTYFDYLAMQEDQVRLQKFTREYNELKERDRELQTQNQSRNQRLQEMARTLLNKELPRVREDIRKSTAEMFAAIFKQTVSAGSLNKPEYASRDAMQQALDQMFDAAYGSALRRARPGAEVDANGAPGDLGYDEADEPRVKKPVVDDEDDFTNNLMYAYNQRKRASLTVAEAKKQAAEREGKGAAQ